MQVQSGQVGSRKWRTHCPNPTETRRRADTYADCVVIDMK